MFSKLLRRVKSFIQPDKNLAQEDSTRPKEQALLSKDINKNIKVLRSVFEHCDDVVMREIEVVVKEPIRALIVFVEGMSDESAINEHIIEAVQQNAAIISRGQRLTGANTLKITKDQVLSVNNAQATGDLSKLVEQVMAGSVALLIDGTAGVIIINVREWKSRSVEEPNSEPLLRGPRDGFTETLRTNTALVRRRIKTPRLKMEGYKIGRLSKTDVVIAYIHGIANDKVVEEVRRRLNRIEIDGIMESNYLEELIEDDPFSVFPQTNITERPDKVAAHLLEGYVAIMVDNTPVSMIVPATFPVLLQSAEDYYNRYPYAFFIRLLRFIALNISLLLPSLYVAIVTFHQEMLPTPFIISIAAQREGTPFPAFIEALFMETVFEILREAGIRLPRQIGQAVSIVGALVIGDAAVNAGLVSPAIVMVVALTAIASFTLPNISASFALRLLRFPIIFMAAFLGLFGVMIALMTILFHLCSLRSFGVPYLSPLTPFNLRDMKDSFIRMPWWFMKTRPALVGRQDQGRQGHGMIPGPHHRGGESIGPPRGKGGKDNA